MYYVNRDGNVLTWTGNPNPDNPNHFTNKSDAIKDCVKDVDRKIEYLDKQLSKLKQYKESLLSELESQEVQISK